MKKFLILLLTPLLLAACNDDEEFTPDAGAYVCSLRVTDASTGQPTLEDTGIECLLTEQPDKSISLTMKDVKFSTSPHEPSKTIVFPRPPGPKRARRPSTASGTTESSPRSATCRAPTS